MKALDPMKPGEQYHFLTVVEWIGSVPYKTSSVVKVRMRCICGKEFVATAVRVRKGYTKHCGCLRNTLMRKLTIEEMESIRNDFLKGMSSEELAFKYQVTDTKVYETIRTVKRNDVIMETSLFNLDRHLCKKCVYQFATSGCDYLLATGRVRIDICEVESCTVHIDRTTEQGKNYYEALKASTKEKRNLDRKRGVAWTKEKS